MHLLYIINRMNRKTENMANFEFLDISIVNHQHLHVRKINLRIKKKNRTVTILMKQVVKKYIMTTFQVVHYAINLNLIIQFSYICLVKCQYFLFINNNFILSHSQSLIHTPQFLFHLSHALKQVHTVTHFCCSKYLS